MLIHELTLRGLLSFGPDTPPFPMRPLNVLIGPNGSGKSNVIEAIGLLRSTPTKLTAPMRGPGGGVAEWIWKGAPGQSAHIDAVVDLWGATPPLLHVLEFEAVRGGFWLNDERIDLANVGPELVDETFYYRFDDGQAVLGVHDGMRIAKRISIPEISHQESILSQVKDPTGSEELIHLGKAYSQIKLYREWSFGRSSVFRAPQAADMPGDHLEEDFSNLGLFLNHLRGVPKAKKAVIENLKDLYEGLSDFDVRVRGGTVEVFLTEGDFVIPAGRLSDGTLRYLCLLAILCDPDPPPLVCIEEPELGLHPDIVTKLADLLVDASERTQLVVTTHSDILVDALTERPESVVVVEKHDGRTQMKRLDAGELAEWLEKYRLGELWTRGQIGGTRW